MNCDKRKQYEEIITHQIQLYIRNASEENKPYHLLNVIEAFNNKDITIFNDCQELHKIVNNNISLLTEKQNYLSKNNA